MNLGGHHRRSVGTAWQVSFGNIGGKLIAFRRFERVHTSMQSLRVRRLYTQMDMVLESKTIWPSRRSSLLSRTKQSLLSKKPPSERTASSITMDVSIKPLPFSIEQIPEPLVLTISFP